MKERKILTFRGCYGQLLKDSINWAGCQNNLIDINFYLQKVWNVLIKIQLTKSDPKMLFQKTRTCSIAPSRMCTMYI